MQTKIKRFSRRTVSIVLAVLMMVSVFAIMGTVNVSAADTDKVTTGASSTYTVYFRNNGGWSNVYVLTGSNLNMSGSDGAYENLYGSSINSFTAMTLVPGETNVYYKNVTVYDNKIAFASTNSSQGGYYASSGQVCCVGNMASGKVVNMWTDNWKTQNGAAYKKYNLENYTPPVPYITGINGDWTNGTAMTLGSSPQYYYSFTGDGNDKYFRFKVNSTYYEAYNDGFNLETDGTYKPYNGTNNNKKYGPREGNSNAFKLNAAIGYNYKIYFDLSTHGVWFTKTAKTSALTFDLNGGSGTAPTGKTATYGSAMPAYGESAPTKTGYIFDGFSYNSTQYYTSALASARSWNVDTTSGTTLTAQWTAKTSALTFDLNGGSGTAPTGITATYDSDMPTYGESAPTKTGYTFAGFSYNNTQYYTSALASARSWNVDTTSGTTLTAQWSADAYSITYKDEGDEDYSGSNSASLPDEHTYGQATALVDGVKSGYRFDGWYTDEDCTVSAGSSLGATDYTDNITLYAKWTAIHSVSRSETPSNGSLQLSADNSSWGNGPLSIAEGDNFYVKATPSGGYKISSLVVGGVTIDGATNSESAYTYTGTMGASNVSVSVEYVLASSPGVTVTANYDNSENKAQIGQAVTVTATKTNPTGSAGAMGISVTVDGNAATAGTSASDKYTVSSSTAGNVTTYTITPRVPGTFVVTASYADTGSPSNSVTFGVKTPTVSITSADNADIGGTVTLTSSYGNSSTAPTYSYSSSNSSAATISSTTLTAGTTAEATSTITVTAVFNNAYSKTATQTFTVNTPTIGLTYAAGNINVGATKAGTTTTEHPSSATGLWTITYTSSNESVATVNSSGTVTGVTGGSVTITAKLCYDSVQKATVTSSTVTINPPSISSFTYANSSFYIDGTSGNPSVSTSNPGSTGGGWTVTYAITSGSSYASINDSGVVTGLTTTDGDSKEVEVTASFRYNNVVKATKTATLTVNPPTISLTNTPVALSVGGTITRTATVSNPGNGAVVYTCSDGFISVNAVSGEVTALRPTAESQTVTATYTLTRDTNKTTTFTATYTVTVGTPVVSCADMTVAVGAHKTLSPSATNTTSPTFEYESDNTSVATVNESGQVVGVAAGTAHITITASEQSWEDSTKVVDVTVQAPAITIPGVNHNGSTVLYSTVGAANTTKALSNNFEGGYTVTSSDESVATVSESSGTLTITPVAKGVTTITVRATKSYTRATVDVEDEVSFQFRVAEADTYKYFYFTNGVGWSGVNIYMWQNSNNNNKNHAWPGEAMVKIGKNENNQDVYAYRYTGTFDRLIISKNGDDSKRVYRTNSDNGDITLGSNNAIWCNTENSQSGSGWYDCTIVRPQITVNDIDDLALGDNATLTATLVNNTTPSKYKWASADTDKVTVTSADTGTTNTNTVTGTNATGTTTVTVTAYSALPKNSSNQSWKSLEYNSADAAPFISGQAAASVTTTADPRTVSWSNKLSVDGTNYDQASPESAGTITVTNGPAASGGTVAHGTSVTFHAVANAGYKHVGWKVDDGAITKTTSDKTVSVTANTTVYALFDRGVNVTFVDGDDFSNAEIEAATFTYYGSAPVTPVSDPVHAGYTFSGWNDGNETYTTTQLASYFIGTDDPDTGTADITFTATYTAVTPQVNFSSRKTDDGSTYSDGDATITAVTGYSEGTPGSTPTPSSYKLLYTTANGDTSLDNNHIDVYKDTTGSKYTAKLTVPTASTNYYFGFSSTTSYTGLVHNNTVTVTRNHSSVTGFGPQNWGGSSHYAYLSVSSANTVVYISFDPASPNAVTLNSSYPNYGGNEVAAVSGDPGTAIYSGDRVNYNDSVRFTAPASYSADGNTYKFVGWYTTANPVENETALGTETTYTSDPLTTDAGITVYARYKRQYYITVYNSYVKDGDGFDLIASAPRTVKVGDRTLQYKAGDDRGEEHIVTASGNYYEGNKILVLAGEEIELTYSGLSSSNNIKGVFFNNSKRYTTELEEDNLYKNRVLYTGDDPKNWGSEGDDSWDYDYAVGTTLYADEHYYSGAAASAITTTKANANYINATVDQVHHKVTWTAKSDYLNIDIEIGDKFKIYVNGDDFSGVDIQNLNDEGYYYNGEAFEKSSVNPTINLDNTDPDCTYTFTGYQAEVKDKGGNNIISGITVTGVQDDGTTLATSVGDLDHFVIEGTMPAKDVYITIPVKKTYNMKLANIIVADNISGKTMITETGSNSVSTNSIGSISAVVKNNGVTDTSVGVSGDISDDGTYYTYPANNKAAHVEAYTSSSSNKYLNGGVNRNGANITAGYSVTYSCTFLGANAANYSFVGWFEAEYADSSVKPTTDFYYDVNYDKKLSGKTSFTYTPKKNTVIVAVATRDIYIGGNFTSDGAYTATAANQTYSTNRILMSYDPTYTVEKDSVTYRGRYYYEFKNVTPNTEYQFRCYDTASGTATTNLSVWTTWSGSDYGQDNNDILFGRHKYDAAYGTSHGQFVYKTNSNNWSLIDNTGDTHSSTKNHQALGYGEPVTVYFYAYDGGITVKSEYQWSTAYVSKGVGIDCTNYEAAAGGTTATFNSPTVSIRNKTVNNKDVVGTGANGAIATTTYGSEDIYKCTVKEKDGQIVVTANPVDTNLELQAFVCYNIDTKESSAVTEFTTDAESNTYTGNIDIPQNSKIYVVPVYKFKDSYIDSAELQSHDVFVNTEDIDKDTWGGLVSMYSWGPGKTASGNWPGQLMIPSADGTSFYAPLTFKVGALKGVTFSNYVPVDGSNNPQSFLGTYANSGVSDTAYSATVNKTYQAYDYREPISIVENIAAGRYGDDMTLTFALKPGNKGTDAAGSSTYKSTYDFEYLTDSSGKNRVDLRGDVVTGTATYYIVCKYTDGYKHQTAGEYDETYSYSEGTRNEFSIDWYVYDVNGDPVRDKSGDPIGLNMLSACFTDIDADSALTVIATKMEENEMPVSGKAVRIAYENPKSFDTVIRYSGQWYNESVNTLLSANIDIGVYADGVYTPSGSSNPGYSSGTVSLVGVTPESGEVVNTGNATVIKSHAYKEKVKFSVSSTDSFIGWYCKVTDSEGNEEYKFISSKREITPSFNTDITYYAFYSAKASYVFEYTSRSGEKQTFSVQGSDVTNDELAAGGILDADTRSTDISTRLTANISSIKVFNKDISYILGEPNCTNPYVIKYTASESDTSYNLTAYTYNGSGALSTTTSVAGGWGSITNLDEDLLNNKPADHSDYVFIGWKEYNPTGSVWGELVSTNPNFGYTLTGDLTVAAHFGTAEQKAEALAGSWNSNIDKNVITQELSSTTSGTLYNDSLIRFQFGGDTQKMLYQSGYNMSTGLMDVSNMPSNAECGLLIIAQEQGSASTYGGTFTNDENAKYLNDSRMQSYANYLRTNNLTSAKLNSSSYGNTYAYRVKVASLSRLNRVHIYQNLDFAKFGGGNYKVIAYYYDGTGYHYSSVVGGTLTSGQKYPVVS